MLRVAVPNKGSLSEAASAMLSEAGYRQRRDTRELVMVDPDNDIEFFFLRPRDIAVYVGQGTLDVGITGRDLLLDAEVEAEELLPLGFAASTFRFAGPVGDFTKVEELEGKRLATSYDGLLRGYLAERGINAKVVRLDGAVESSVRLGVADAIADVVETGNTLKAAGMEIFGDPILKSEAVLIRRRQWRCRQRHGQGDRGPDPPPAGCAGGAPVRPDGLRHPQGTRGTGCLADARPGITHGLAAA
jgi:ATP phosphoribosyltransferase